MLALDKFMRPQRHPLSQTSHHKRISSTQQSQIHRERDILRMQQHDGLIGERAESRVDVRDDVGDGCLELVLFGSSEGDLDEDYLALEFGIALEEAFECYHFVSHALEGRVETRHDHVSAGGGKRTSSGMFQYNGWGEGGTY